MNPKNFKTVTIFLGIITSFIIISKNDYILKYSALPKETIHHQKAQTTNDAPKSNNEKSSCFLESNFISAYIKMRSTETQKQTKEIDEGETRTFNLFYKLVKRW